VEEAEYEPVMLFINHSCEPSVGFAGNIVLVAMRDISAGEELTTDADAGPHSLMPRWLAVAARRLDDASAG
jgi:hypothetical protein